MLTSATTTTSKVYILNTTVKTNVYLTAHSTTSTNLVSIITLETTVISTTIHATTGYNLTDIKTSAKTETIMNQNLTIFYSIMVFFLIIITTLTILFIIINKKRTQELEFRMEDSATFNIMQNTVDNELFILS